MRHTTVFVALTALIWIITAGIQLIVAAYGTAHPMQAFFACCVAFYASKDALIAIAEDYV